jgi:hypothetical protein
MFAPVGVRRRKNPSGINGCETRDSIRMKAAMSAAERSSRPIVCVEPQPLVLAWVSA